MKIVSGIKIIFSWRFKVVSYAVHIVHSTVICTVPTVLSLVLVLVLVLVLLVLLVLVLPVLLVLLLLSLFRLLVPPPPLLLLPSFVSVESRRCACCRRCRALVHSSHRSQ